MFYGSEAYVGVVDGLRLCGLRLSSDFPVRIYFVFIGFCPPLVEFLVVGDHFFMETAVNVVEHALPEIGS
jgi:hypothetical protein